MTITVTMIGVGEAFDAVEPSASVLVAAAGFEVLIDCGHAAIQALWRKVPEVERIDAIYVTHRHADHILGLVPLLDRWASERRRKPVTLFSSGANIVFLQQLFEMTGVPSGPRGPFPVNFVASDCAVMLGPFGMRVARTEHGGDNHAVLLEYSGKRFAYSGDGRPTDKSRQIFAAADLLMHECFSPSVEDQAPGHCTLEMIRTILGPQQIGLYHVRAGMRPFLRAAIAGDSRFFLPEAGDVLSL